MVSCRKKLQPILTDISADIAYRIQILSGCGFFAPIRVFLRSDSEETAWATLEYSFYKTRLKVA